MAAKKVKPEVNVGKVMASVSSVVSFMKEQGASDLVNAKSSGKIDVSPEDLKKICFYVETSLSNSFVKASGQIESSLK